MATIDRIPLTDAESLNILAGATTTPFHLTEYNDGTSTLELAGGRTEEIGGYLYKVNNGDYAITTTAATTDGTWYVHVADGGTGVATAYLNANAGTWDANKGGYYFGTAKVIMSVEKLSTAWNERVPILRPNIFFRDLYIGNDVNVGNELYCENKISVGEEIGGVDAELYINRTKIKNKIGTFLSTYGGSYKPPTISTEDTIFNQLQIALPNVGDTIMCNGFFARVVGADEYIYLINRMSRESSTTILFNTARQQNGSTWSTIIQPITDGSTDNIINFTIAY